MKSKFTDKQKEEVVHLWKKEGIKVAMKKYGLSDVTVYAWNKTFGLYPSDKAGTKLQPRVNRSQKLKREIAAYSFEHGIKEAIENYQVSPSTLSTWRKKYKPKRKYKRRTTEESIPKMIEIKAEEAFGGAEITLVIPHLKIRAKTVEVINE